MSDTKKLAVFFMWSGPKAKHRIFQLFQYLLASLSALVRISWWVKRSKIERHKSSEKIPVQPDEFWYVGLEITFRKNPTKLSEVNKDGRKSQKTTRSCWTAGSVQKFTVLPAAGSDWGRITTITAKWVRFKTCMVPFLVQTWVWLPRSHLPTRTTTRKCNSAKLNDVGGKAS